MQQPPSSPEITTLLYRMTAMEQDVTQLKAQLALYEPTRENDLKLQRINDTVQRIETELVRCKDKLETMSTTIAAQELSAIERDTQNKDSLNKIQIRVLWFVVSAIFLAVLSFIGVYLSHLF